jgi:hypothetical protein
MRKFKSKSFIRWMRREAIPDDALYDALERIQKGLADAVLGGDVYKQRIARQGQGRRGGYRSIILFRTDYRAFFVHGFDKASTDNINQRNLADFKKLASVLMAVDDEKLQTMIDNSDIKEF